MNNDEMALAYLKGELNDAERAGFEARLADSPEARTALEGARALLGTLEAANEESVVRQVNALLVEAIQARASDLHLLPERRDFAVRLRVDGALRDLASLPKKLQTPVIDRIKLMADMHLSERRVPQDGRIPIRHQNKDYDLRVCALPTLYGEHIAIRILSREAVDARLGLDRLVLGAAQVAALRRLARRPAGLVVVTGNADTGKTTLLYSLLQEIQSPDLPRRSLFTIEDPIELQLPGVAQTAIAPRAGLTFEAALKSMLRSDADVLLCGEVRSLAIAERLVELAHTGRLVLTALHVASAPSVLDWMTAVGIERFLVAQTVAGTVALRLVGRICEACKEEYRPAAEEIRRAGLSTVEDGPFFRGRGCDACGGTGIKGRVPLCEVLEMDAVASRRRSIAAGIDAEALWEEALGTDAAPSLRDDARARIRAGEITVEAANWVLTDYPHGLPSATASNKNIELPTEGFYPLPPTAEEA